MFYQAPSWEIPQKTRARHVNSAKVPQPTVYLQTTITAKHSNAGTYIYTQDHCMQTLYKQVFNEMDTP